MAGNKLRRNRRARSYSAPPHVRLYDWALGSVAWGKLSFGARCLLIVLYSLYNGRNNGSVHLSVREARDRLSGLWSAPCPPVRNDKLASYWRRRRRPAKSTVELWLAELIEVGFIRIAQRGSFDTKVRHATEWILTEFEYDGRPPEKAFMRWRQPDTASNIKQKPVLRGSADGPSGEDRGSNNYALNRANGPSVKDRKRMFDVFDGPSEKDTDREPYPVGCGTEAGAAEYAEWPNRDELVAFGATVRSARHRLGLTQEQVAEVARVARSTLANIEKGKYRASADIASRLRELLGQAPQ